MENTTIILNPGQKQLLRYFFTKKRDNCPQSIELALDAQQLRDGFARISECDGELIIPTTVEEVNNFFEQLGIKERLL